MRRPEPTPSAQPGYVIAGRFRVEHLLGVGGMAEVYATTDLATGRLAAVKLLKRDIAGKDEAIERLKREAQVLRSLEHPGIVRLETFGALDDTRIFIAMELLEGETLGARLRRVRTLDPADLTPVVDGVCGALEAAHARGIVHRDLKPDNIFLVEADQHPVKVLDFGVSKVTGSDQLTATGEVLGTPRYMAPEQLAAERDLDGRTDLYALGVLLYEALAGRPPFLASVPTELIVAILHGKVAPLRSYRPDLSETLEAVVTRAMARAREARFQSASQLARAWNDAVPTSLTDGGPGRTGVSTVALGSMGAPAVEVGRASEEGKRLQAGTFSAFAAPPPPVAAPAVPAAVRPAAAVRPGSPERPLHVPPTQAVPTAPPVQASPAQIAHVPRQRFPEATSAIRLPTHTGRIALIVIGLIAGIASATAAVWALRSFGREAEPSAPALMHTPSEGPSGPGAQEQSDPGTPVREPSTRGGSAMTEPAPASGSAAEESSPRPGTDSTPAVVAPTPEAVGSAPEPPSSRVAPRRPRRRPRDRRRQTPQPRSMTATPSAIAAPRSAAELLRDARTALRQGETTMCLDLVERAMARHGGSSALRLQGDCHLRAGNRAGALRSYERFCRLAGDHPAIEEVRGLVESMGGQCR